MASILSKKLVLRRNLSRLASRWGRYIGAFYLLLILVVALRPFFLTYGADAPPPALSWRKLSDPPPPAEFLSVVPPETDAPPPALYGTSSERCFILGHNNASNQAWHMNSRALCSFDAPVCLSGNHLEHITTFGPRGSGTCNIASISNETQLFRADKHGLSESCAGFRRRHVIDIYGDEQFAKWDPFLRDIGSRVYEDPDHHAASWHSDFAIIVPKYKWSWNICHYNRVWNFVAYVIKNLAVFAPNTTQNIFTVDILFRSGIQYGGNWPRGLREATIPALENETGLKIRVGQIRFDGRRDYQCVKKGILLGDEGRVDAFPFFNDTAIWTHDEQKNDNHWPSIPEQALWSRHAVYTKFGLDDKAVFDGPGVSNFRSIPLPPKRVAYLMRNARSRRRLTTNGNIWFEKTLIELVNKYDFDLRNIRFQKDMSLSEQVEKVHDVGVAVGLHGANMVNTMFMPAGSAMFEIFPWRYVRYYYAGGLNSGLRYSYHEPASGQDRHCSFDTRCFMYYRESVIYLNDQDRVEVRRRMENAIRYIADLHVRYPNGSIPLEKHGRFYRMPKRT